MTTDATNPALSHAVLRNLVRRNRHTDPINLADVVSRMTPVDDKPFLVKRIARIRRAQAYDIAVNLPPKSRRARYWRGIIKQCDRILGN